MLRSFLLSFIIAGVLLGSCLATESLSRQLRNVVKQRSFASYNSANLLSLLATQAKIIDSLTTQKENKDSATVKAQLTCQIASLLFPSQHISRNNSQYQTEIEENWSSTCWLPAQCFIRPENSLQIATLLRIIDITQSKFAVRSGGHNPNAGFASSGQTGIVLDLSQLNSIDLSQDRSFVEVGPGVRWGEVYEYLDPYNLSAIGGRSPPVGAGGLLLGGGMPYIPSLYGLACDNVKAFEIVLANSTLIKASAVENPDLFFSLKGGGPNFGIVTRYDLYTRPLHQVWYQFNLYNFSQYESVLAATVKTQDAMEEDDRAGFVFNANQGSILVGFIHEGWSDAPAVFQAFDGIPLAGVYSKATNGTIATMSKLLDIGSSTAAFRQPVAVSHQYTLPNYLEAFRYFLAHRNYTSDPTADLSFAIQPIGKSAVEAGRRAGGNPLGLTAVPQNWFNTLADWSQVNVTEEAQAAVAGLQKKVESLATDSSLLLPYQFQNDANFNQSPLRSYGNDQLARLIEVSERYDPARVFQRLQNGGFLVSTA